MQSHGEKATGEDKALASSRSRGSGTQLLGEIDHRLACVDGKITVSVVKTKFFCLLSFPLIPLGSYRVIIGESSTEGNLLAGRITRTQLLVLEKLPLHFRQVAEIYGFSLLCLIWWPIALLLGRNLLGPRPGQVQSLVFFGLLIGGFFLWMLGLYSLAGRLLRQRMTTAVAAQIRELQTRAAEKKRAEKNQDDTRFMPPELRPQKTDEPDGNG